MGGRGGGLVVREGRYRSGKQPWGFAVLVQQGAENSVAFLKLTFKILMIQWSHCCIILVIEIKFTFII